MSRPMYSGPSVPWLERYRQIASVIATMCASLNAPFNDDPRCPDVPNATRWAGSAGSGRVSWYAPMSRSTSTRMEGSAGRPARSLFAIGRW